MQQTSPRKRYTLLYPPRSTKPLPWPGNRLQYRQSLVSRRPHCERRDWKEPPMTHGHSSPTGGSHHDGVDLRLLWPQWQGAGASSVEVFASEFPLDVARRGYVVGTAVLEAVLPPHDGPTVSAPVAMSDDGLEERDGVEAKAVILEQLARALEVIRRHDPARIITLGGECSVSVAPFSELARSYGEDLAIVWIDAHPDVDAVDSNEIVLGLGMEPNGLSSGEVRRIVADVDGAVDVVGFTLAEFIPRQVMHLRQILNGFPLVSGTTAD